MISWKRAASLWGSEVLLGVQAERRRQQASARQAAAEARKEREKAQRAAEARKKPSHVRRRLHVARLARLCCERAS